MVAISLYRGNLHRVPDLPRRWLMPNPGITLRDFRRLVGKRAKALSLLSTTITKQEEEGVGDNESSKPQITSNKDNENVLEENLPQKITEDESEDRLRTNDNDALEDPKVNDVSPSKPAEPDTGNDREDRGATATNAQEEKVGSTDEAKLVENNSLDALNDKAKRKKEVEKKLEFLNERKHQLVQMLKQILNAEEEMKKRNSIQASSVRGAVPLPVEATLETMGSITRHAIPKTSSEMNSGGDLGGESEDVSNHNTHARSLYLMHNTSPSAASPLRRPAFGSIQHNTVPLTSQTSLVASGHGQITSNMLTGVTASPSRFAPPGHQGHAPNVPSVSVSGTPFIASSPSPAASGGTSVFRDSRLTSPTWN
ncbi:uncharacterized protein LOC143847992 isoform X1 [Tasmannia lanceolata]|uniref:uncharacterized protein LOC143847992 isoform X1 n=1 Tax=Tasmannia lanceolata TaxID=3420 RepID=UPI004062805E